MKPSVLILHASGANRDAEAARACEMAGAAPEIVHINQLRRGVRTLAAYQMLLLPGGFSYGDALGAGARLALDLQIYLHDELHAFIDRGGLVLGICNGFQTLVKAGVLPGVARQQGRTMTEGGDAQAAGGDEIARRRVTLTANASGHFECRWVHLAANRQASASFLHTLDELVFCPVAHGEGNVQVKDDAMLAEIEQRNLIAFRYVDAGGNPAHGAYPLNPNGSVADIAGLCNHRGNVVGLMPHPEDHLLPVQNPLGSGGRLGRKIFEAMVQAL